MKKSLKSSEDKLNNLLEALEFHSSTKQLIWKNFLKGISFSLGTTVGLAIIIALLTYFISQLKTIPLLEQIITTTNLETILPQKNAK